MSLYDILGVPRDATTNKIKKAYHRLALVSHPDKNPGDQEATERFKTIVGAYEILSNPEKRQRYDRGELNEQSAVMPDDTIAKELFATFCKSYFVTRNVSFSLLVTVFVGGYHVLKQPDKDNINTQFIDTLRSTRFSNDAEKLAALNACIAAGADINYRKSVFIFMKISALEIMLAKNMPDTFISLILNHPKYKPTDSQLNVAIKQHHLSVANTILRGVKPQPYHLATAINVYRQNENDFIQLLLNNNVPITSDHMDEAINHNILFLADYILKNTQIRPNDDCIRTNIKNNNPTLVEKFIAYGAKPDINDLLCAIENDQDASIKAICSYDVTNKLFGLDTLSQNDAPLLADLAIRRKGRALQAVGLFSPNSQTALDYFNAKTTRSNQINFALKSLALLLLANLMYELLNKTDKAENTSASIYVIATLTLLGASVGNYLRETSNTSNRDYMVNKLRPSI